MSDKQPIIEKIRKLLAMAEDGRGNAQEAETAARQAAALMRAHQLERADLLLEELAGGESMDSAWVRPAVGQEGIPYKRVEDWVQWLASGVAILTEVNVQIQRHRSHGMGIAFMGYAEDVLFARWMLIYLIGCANRGLRISFPDGASRSRGREFREAFALEMNRRLRSLAEEQKPSVTSNGTAIVLYNAKRKAVEEAFGAQEWVKAKDRQFADTQAVIAGMESARKVNISRNRPIENGNVSAAMLK